MKLAQPVVLAALAGAIAGSAATWLATNTTSTYNGCILRYVRAGMDRMAVVQVRDACESTYGLPPKK